MNFKELHKTGEGQQVEFKTSFGKETIETVAAFSNASGGTILIGIDQNGKVKGVSVNDEIIKEWVKEDYIAMHRNKLLTEAFYLRGDIEKFGTGFFRIQLELKDSPEIQFSVESLNGFMRSELKVSILDTPQDTEQVVPIGREEPSKLGDRLGDRLGDKLGDKLGDNQMKIIAFIKKKPKISLSRLSKEIGISQTAVEKNISKLKKRGIIKRIGPTKGGYWQITEMK